MKNKIVVIGSSNVYLIMKMERLPGKRNHYRLRIFQVYGEKGANTAVGAARAGGNVAFINCVGEDAYTPSMIQNFITDGIDCSRVFQVKNIHNDHALIMIGGDGNNTFQYPQVPITTLHPKKSIWPLIKLERKPCFCYRMKFPAR